MVALRPATHVQVIVDVVRDGYVRQGQGAMCAKSSVETGERTGGKRARTVWRMCPVQPVCGAIMQYAKPTVETG